MSVLRAVVSIFPTGEEGPVERRPPQGKTLGVSDTFNIQEKRYLLSWVNEQARKFGLKTVKPRQNQRQKSKLFFIDPAAARSGTTLVGC